MLAFLLLILVPFLFLITRSALGESNQKQISVRRYSLYFHLILISFYFLTIYLEGYNYYIKGYRSTSILFISMTIAGITYWLVDRDKVVTHFFRLIGFCFTVLTVISSVFLLIELFSDYNNQLYYNDKDYRLEDTRRGINEPCILPILFVKSNIYERKYTPNDSTNLRCINKRDLLKIEIKKITQNQISVIYFLNDEPANQSTQLQITYLKE